MTITRDGGPPEVAALFVDPYGPYFCRGDIDPWGEARDARNYDGTLPVVAHPPCQRWINFTRLNFARYGGEHNRPGNDGGCFLYALEIVKRCGGVIEHPAGSYAWSHYGLQRPKRGNWQRDTRNPRNPRNPHCWVTEVDQAAYGHRARKRTWLIYHGLDEPFALDWTPTDGTHQIGYFDRHKPVIPKREAALTPPAFADVLIRLAKWSVVHPSP